jgi:biotin carboxyl carrier protein
MKYVVSLNGKQYEVDVEKSEAVLLSVQDIPAPAVAAPQASATAAVPQPLPSAGSFAGGEQILAPMPGTVLSVNVSVGDVVVAGQILLVFEAMKMENEIAAPKNGTVHQVLTSKGASMNTNDVLFVL